MLKLQLSALIFSGFWKALDWIFPPECAACGEPGYRLCLKCQNKIKFIHDTNSTRRRPGKFFGVHSKFHEGTIPDWCSDSRHMAHYEGVVRECIHSLKYHENRGLGELFSQWLAQLVEEAGWSIDLVLPVPLSAERLQERGYNQAALVARPLAARLKVPFSTYGLARILDTPSQVGLSAEERRVNVAMAFKAEQEVIQSRAILLVDDVMTTGSTLSACARALLRAGASSIYAVTIARHIDKISASSMKSHQV